ncbi:hypothetical protein Ctha_1999 [Chloroherpeton thalassium ATCC 35110]|uniref:Uncharacterized protein n=1 Tax=Chloroherpeton thalassium (strain ATCC 35110 / GB-78) TaxID=517418 RepID=B3QUV2_CHLT3|nr:hypothetical protein [Chloroherpeton thalassium]ACF14453.1 hypothetical protein Ctha_1999 [Chloroherpeton thalassium ATCC 35110]
MDEKLIRKTVVLLCSEVIELCEVYGKAYDFFYDETELALHVSFDLEQDADGSFFASPSKSVDGEVLVHTFAGQIVGFSVLYREGNALS